jgi:transposase
MIEFPLDIPEPRFLNTELKKRQIVITVESARLYAICSRCGQKTFEFHSYDDPIRLRRLPILEQRVLIELRPKRFRCPTCDDHPTTTQQCDWYEPRSPHNKAFDLPLLRQLIKSTVSDVARKQEASYDSVLGAIDRGVERCVNWGDFAEPSIELRICFNASGSISKASSSSGFDFTSCCGVSSNSQRDNKT